MNSSPLSTRIYNSLEDYCETLQSSDNKGRYELGSFIIPAASLVLPMGMGIASKATKVKASLKALLEASKEDLAKVGKRLAEVGRKGLKAEAGSTSALDDLPAGNIATTSRYVIDLPSPAGKFRQLTAKNKKTYRAADFWKETNDEFTMFTSSDAGYLIKHDPATGRLLFADLKNKKFLGFALDEEGLIGGDYEKLLLNLKAIHGLGGAKALKVGGKTISLSVEKANVFFGKYNPNSIPGIYGEIGTNDIINELGILKNHSFADEAFELRPGSIHVLNIPEEMAMADDFFGTYNKEFMDMVLANKDKVNVILVSDPRKAGLLKVYRDGIPTMDPSGLAKEIRYLRDHGLRQIALRDGSTIDLDAIDLTKLNWTTWKY